MSRLRPHTVKASLSDEEKKAITAIAKRHEMSEAELIRFALCNADDLDIDFGFSEIDDQKFRTDDIHVRVSPEEKTKIESNADSLDMTVSAYARRVLLKGNVEKIDVDRASIDKIYHELLKEGTNLNQLMYFVNAQGLLAYNEKAVFRTLEKVYQVGRKLDRFIDEFEKRYFVGGDQNDRH